MGRLDPGHSRVKKENMDFGIIFWKSTQVDAKRRLVRRRRSNHVDYRVLSRRVLSRRVISRRVMSHRGLGGVIGWKKLRMRRDFWFSRFSWGRDDAQLCKKMHILTHKIRLTAKFFIDKGQVACCKTRSCDEWVTWPLRVHYRFDNVDGDWLREIEIHRSKERKKKDNETGRDTSSSTSSNTNVCFLMFSSVFSSACCLSVCPSSSCPSVRPSVRPAVHVCVCTH